MSGKTSIEQLHSVIEEAAGLLGTACSRDRIWPVLTAFQDVMVSPIVFNTVTSGGRIGELCFDFVMPGSAGDPYELALSHGLVEETDHRIRTLFSDIQARFPVQTYGVDYGVTGGFHKAYAAFPLGDLQELTGLADVPSMPDGLSEHLGRFAEHGLDGKVSAIAIDYQCKTWNVYFNGLSAEHVERRAVLPLLRELGLPAPSEHMLRFIEASSALYPTFGWDSSKVERISFSAKNTVPTGLPAHIGPTFEKFARNAPYTYEGERVIIYAGALSASEEYYKLAAYYQMASTTHDRFRSAS